MVKLQFDEKQFKVTLPKKLIEALSWQKGDEIVVQLKNSGEIVLINSKKSKRAEYED